MPDSEIFKVVFQGGCFGLLALLVWWALWRGIPKALEIHQSTISGITETFTKEAAGCREERKENAERMDRELAKRDAALKEAIAEIKQFAHQESK